MNYTWRSGGFIDDCYRGLATGCEGASKSLLATVSYVWLIYLKGVDRIMKIKEKFGDYEV